MTVSELIETLKQQPADRDVWVRVPDGVTEATDFQVTDAMMDQESPAVFIVGDSEGQMSLMEERLDGALKSGQQAEDRCTCGACGLSWDNGIVTSITPTPAGRCPFEYFHIYEEEDEDDGLAELLLPGSRGSILGMPIEGVGHRVADAVPSSVLLIPRLDKTPPEIVVQTGIYDNATGEDDKEKHPFKIELGNPGLCIVFGDKGGTAALNTGDAPNIVIERQINPSQYMVLIHADGGDPACRIEITDDSFKVFRGDSDELLHEQDRG